MHLGEELDIEKVKVARAQEVKFLQDEGIYEKRDYGECLERTGKNLTTVRWIDTDKGTTGKPNIRCRLVEPDCEDRGSVKDDLFAAMPPLEAKKLIFAMCAARWRRFLAREVHVP